MIEFVDNCEFAKAHSIKYRKREYSTRIITFDTETTSYKKGDEYRATLYLWQACNGATEWTCYGRDYASMNRYFKRVAEANAGAWQVIFIHNLGFDFEFLRNLDYDWEVFARTRHKPIFARCEALKIEIRDSYTYFHKSLDRLGEDLKLSHRKLTGYNYDLIRHSQTPLTQDELDYGNEDVVTLFCAIEKELKQYKHVCKLPYTQTGKVRRVVMKKVLYHKRFDQSHLVPHSRGFFILQKAFLGGFTHANFKYAGDILENVDSDDLASSYPAVMISEKYPRGKFIKVSSLKKGYCHIIRVVLHDIVSAIDFPYLPTYSVIHAEGIEADNGKVWRAKRVEYIMTDVDYAIVRKCYNIGKIELLEIYASKAGYLPKPFVEYVLDLYEAKTTLKGVEGREEDYAIAKEYVNSLYGMTVTNNVRDEIEFFDVWSKHDLTREEVDAKLTKMREGGQERLAYQWGVFVTAYGRRNLFRPLYETKGECVAYVDTDSLKTVFETAEQRERFRDVLRRLNEEQVKHIDEALKAQGIDPQRARPRNAKGKECQIGVFDYEGQYTKFRTWGAKKYAYEKDGKQGVTVSGLGKGIAVTDPSYSGVEDFTIGRTWSEEYSGRTVSTYCENMPHETLTDYLGNTMEVTDRFGVNIEKTTYTLGITDEYAHFVGYDEEDDTVVTEGVTIFNG